MFTFLVPLPVIRRPHIRKYIDLIYSMNIGFFTTVSKCNKHRILVLYCFRWFLERDGKLEESLGSYLTGSSGGSRQSGHLGPILLSQVRAEDSGKVFVCWVNNSISQDTARVQLNVYGEQSKKNSSYLFLSSFSAAPISYNGQLGLGHLDLGHFGLLSPIVNKCIDFWNILHSQS